ncbi:hypothetical protein AB0H71_28965 [Nocardia sp. NPDC050697]|uniref:hypothetical protein n=1 Tax=Nocardia sp. NPDC050697 TaxID=3155158 RepID=UPI0033F99D88
MSEHLDQPALITRAEILEVQDTEQLLDLRRHMAAVALNALDTYYAITDVLVAEGVEGKSRRKRVTELET